MSDVIQAPGLYRQKNGKPADVKWVGDGKALGIDYAGEPTMWDAATGRWALATEETDFHCHITGPWIPDPPEPPAGFQVMPKDYVAKDGDMFWCNGIWDYVGELKTRASLDEYAPHCAPHYIASPIPKPFRISDKGCGVYETRDGQEYEVTEFPAHLRNYDDFVWWDKGAAKSWRDDGTWSSRTGPQRPENDLVRYLRPLPKPAVDPGEGWRLLGDEESPQLGDEFGFREYVSGGNNWVKYPTDDYHFRKTLNRIREFQGDGFVVRRRVDPQPESKLIPKPAVDPGEGWRLLGIGERVIAGDEALQCGRWFQRQLLGDVISKTHYPHRRRVVAKPAEQPEWTPTNGLRLAKTALDDPLGTWYGKGADSQWLRIEQRWTNGTASEWRPVTVEGA